MTIKQKILLFISTIMFLGGSMILISEGYWYISLFIIGILIIYYFIFIYKNQNHHIILYKSLLWFWGCCLGLIIIVAGYYRYDSYLNNQARSKLEQYNSKRDDFIDGIIYISNNPFTQTCPLIGKKEYLDGCNIGLSEANGGYNKGIQDFSGTNTFYACDEPSGSFGYNCIYAGNYIKGCYDAVGETIGENTYHQDSNYCEPIKMYNGEIIDHGREFAEKMGYEKYPTKRISDFR